MKAQAGEEEIKWEGKNRGVLPPFADLLCEIAGHYLDSQEGLAQCEECEGESRRVINR